MGRFNGCPAPLGQGGSGFGGKTPGREEFRYSVTGTIPAVVGSTLTVSIKTFSDSWFLCKKLIALSTGDFLTQIQETGSGVILSNLPVRQNNLWGTAQRPNILLDPLVVAPSSTINFLLTNNIAGANTFQFVLEGYKHFDLQHPPIQPMTDPVRPFAGTVKWFQYVINTTLAASGINSVFTPIQSDSNFIARKYVSVQSGTYQTRFSDSASRQPWMDNYIQNANMFGTIQFPNVPTSPRLVRANSSIQSEIQDLSAASNTVQIVLEGVKQYI